MSYICKGYASSCPLPVYVVEIKNVYIETYGCQMNVSDSEIVASILKKEGYAFVDTCEEASLILLNTCAIREKAEQTVRNRLAHFHRLKKIHPHLRVGMLGCMAERLKKKLLEEEKLVDLVVGPDAYRSLPALLVEVEEGHKAVNTLLSREETYANIAPLRLQKNGVTAFISIMRGCDNMCSFCVVPFTRGRERSRDPYTIVEEAHMLFEKGYRDITLLGQNVDSYKWSSASSREEVHFAELLMRVARVHPDLRVRFSTSHPKDMQDEVLHAMRAYDNICKYIHLPVQSGHTDVLARMNRGYDRAWYLSRVEAIRCILGEDCGLSSDMIAGFCKETELEHQETLRLMEEVQYDFSYMFMYSERPGTYAARKYNDDVPLEVKKRRLGEIIACQRACSLARHQKDIGKTHKVLIEGASRRSPEYLQGRNSANKVLIFPKETHQIGTYVQVEVHDCTTATLLGKVQVPEEEVAE